jgi:hypothetical protein
VLCNTVLTIRRCWLCTVLYEETEIIAEMRSTIEIVLTVRRSIRSPEKAKVLLMMILNSDCAMRCCAVEDGIHTRTYLNERAE